MKSVLSLPCVMASQAQARFSFGCRSMAWAESSVLKASTTGRDDSYSLTSIMNLAETTP